MTWYHITWSVRGDSRLWHEVATTTPHRVEECVREILVSNPKLANLHIQVCDNYTETGFAPLDGHGLTKSTGP